MKINPFYHYKEEEEEEECQQPTIKYYDGVRFIFGPFTTFELGAS